MVIVKTGHGGGLEICCGTGSSGQTRPGQGMWEAGEAYGLAGGQAGMVDQSRHWL